MFLLVVYHLYHQICQGQYHLASMGSTLISNTQVCSKKQVMVHLTSTVNIEEWHQDLHQINSIHMDLVVEQVIQGMQQLVLQQIIE